MSTSNAPSKRSSDDDKTLSKPKLNLPKLNVTITPSSLKKPKSKPMAVPLTKQLWKCIHIVPEDGGEDSVSGFLLMCDRQLEVNMYTPLYHQKDPDILEYLTI
jgi:hypothetical protein